MGVTHLGAFSKLANVEVAAIGSRSPQVLAGDLSGTGGNLNRPPVQFDLTPVRKYTDWRQMVSESDLEIVDICLPTHLHSAAVVAALQSGKHVLCEKPMAATLEDCQRMIETAEEAGRVLMIAQVLRFWPEYEFLRDFVKSQPYGPIRSATFVRQTGIPDWSSWLTDERLSGGAVLDLLVHDIDQILMLFGMPEWVAAKRITDGDTLTATFIYPGSTEVRLQGGWFAPGTPFSMSFQVRAERASLDWRPEGLMLSNENGKLQAVALSAHDPYEAEIEYFVECCQTGARPERCLPEDSARSVELALILKRSRAEGGAQIRCLV